MKPLIVLVVVFVLALLCTKIFSGRVDVSLSGRIAMSVMLVFTAIGHFKFEKGMALMMPDFIPFKTGLVYFTGILEILAAIGLLISAAWAGRTGWCLIIFFIVLLPANINAAIKNVDYEKANFEGPGLRYLWFRVPLQLFFICWVYFFAISLNGLVIS